MIQAIETRYKGYRFRSRLEARWAVYFDALGIEWVYEQEGYKLPDGSLYLPDFYLPVLGCFAEVKPTKFTPEEYNKCTQLDKPCLLLDTQTPMSEAAYYATINDGWATSYFGGADEYGWVILPESATKGRLWFLLGEPIGAYFFDPAPDIAARSARFEFGETP
jgi:hypothetical protein